jgi:CubicO group peptidase (beta-lactamase class C family)
VTQRPAVARRAVANSGRVDADRLTDRLAELAGEHGVPGASVAVLVDDSVTAAATGVLSLRTGVEVTTDSLFQMGSISKAYTATMLMHLVERGITDLDTRVADILPGFPVGPGQIPAMTLRHLLTHSSGLDGDFFEDTGRGDDCLERYVEACTGLAPLHAPDLTMSYCNAGYSILGRVIEVLTGRCWDDALDELLLTPLGVAQTCTLPEQALLHRSAAGHETDGEGVLRPVRTWGLPRSAGPAGNITATVADVLAFARLHLRGGLTRDGARVLRDSTTAAMRQAQVVVPNPYGRGDRWGIGWALFDWDGAGVYGHDGTTIGQLAVLRVVPGAEVAVAAAANSDRADRLLHDLVAGLLWELAGLRVPPPPEPPLAPLCPPADLRRYAGVYARNTVRFEAVVEDDGLVLRVTDRDRFGTGPKDYEIRLTPLPDGRFAGRWPHSAVWQYFRFERLRDGTECLHVHGRATPRVR